MSKYVLITTTTCSKCPAIKRELESMWLDFEVINETDEELFPKYVWEYDLVNAPSLIDIEEHRVINYESFLH